MLTLRTSALAMSMTGAVLLLGSTGCGLLGPSCSDESGTVLNATGQVVAGGTSTHDVVSPKHSNLFMRLTWTDPDATLGLRATVTSCGEHTGCSMDTMTPTFGPGGSSPVPQPWPTGLREMLVDGTRGKSYRVQVTGDGSRDASFTLAVMYRITCER